MLADIPLDLIRRFYAEEIRSVAGLTNERLVQAFARVHREDFLGRGPWLISYMDTGASPTAGYRKSPDDDPRHLYHNVAIALDNERKLNNGQPSALATWAEALDLREGGRVFHLGCGVGYYTAIFAETVGPRGDVLAVEVEPELAERARRNLSGYSNVEVISGDGAAIDPGPRDAIFVNAGVTHAPAMWLDRLQPAGTLLVPLTVGIGPTLGKGVAMLIRRESAGFSARATSFVAIYSCTSLRDPQLHQDLTSALSSWSLFKVQSLRRDKHDRGETCVLHGADYCLSTESVSKAAAS